MIDTHGRYLVTGGAGFIGSHLVDALVAGGAAVTVLDIKPWEVAKQNLNHQKEHIAYVTGDICDQTLMNELVQAHEYIFHQAAVVSVPLSIENPLGTHHTNVTGTNTVFEAAARGGIRRVVYASSAAVYGNTTMVPVSEEETLAPLSPYALHKLINEQTAQYYRETNQLETVGLRYFNVYGVRQDPQSPYAGVISLFAAHAQAGTSPTVYGDGEQTRDFVSVADVVEANLKAMHATTVSEPVFNIGTGQETSLNALLKTISTVAGTPVEPVYTAPRVGDIHRSCADITKAQSCLDFIPQTSLADGLQPLLIQTETP